VTAGSPSIDSATSAGAPAADFDGVPRALDGNTNGASAYDMGAYEFIHPNGDSNTNGLSDGWELLYGGGPMSMSATIDLDGDGFSNLSEYRAGSDPTNAASFLGLVSPPSAGSPTGIVVRWMSSTGRVYSVDRSTPEESRQQSGGS
jgi:hypothetical protein